MKDNLNIN